MHIPPIIVDLSIILGVAGIVMLCCRQLKQPLVLGYLLAGIIIGPYTPNYLSISDPQGVSVIAEMGVIFLMFSIGLDFSFHKLKRIGKPALTISIFEVLVMIGVGYVLGRALHWNMVQSLFLGAALSVSSTTIIIKAFNEMKLKRAPFAELVVGVLVVEDLLAILLLIGLPLLAISTTGSIAEVVFHEVVKLILVISAWFLVGYFVVPTIFKKWIREASDEVLIVVSVALCFGMVCLAVSFNYSVALGAFIMGSILAETQESERIERLIEPLRDVYAAVFFVAIGMLIDPNKIWEHLGTVLIITLVTIVAKSLASFIGGYFGTRRLSLSAQVGLSMAQIGEFSFIIVALGVGLHLLDDTFYAIIVAVSVLTTFTTPYFIRYSGKLAEILKKREKPPRTISKKNTRTLPLGKFRATLKENLLTYLINLIIVAIIFSLLRFFPFIKVQSSLALLISNSVFLVFYLCAAPFIAMLFITPFRVDSHLFKVSGIAITLLELYGLLFHWFPSHITFMVWLGLMLILSFVLQKMWIKIYAWMAAHLLGNLKQDHDKSSH